MFSLGINNQKLVVSVGPLLAKVSSNLLKGNKIDHSFSFASRETEYDKRYHHHHYIFVLFTFRLFFRN